MARKRTEHRRRPLSVLYEDDHWLAVNKPPGVPVHSGAGKVGPSVLERLAIEHPGENLHLVHRLDRGTGGVLLLARTHEFARAAAEIWPKVDKRYWAVTAGRPQAPQTIEVPLVDGHGRAKPARTDLSDAIPFPKFEEPLAAACWLRLRTGRLHQIRRHLAHVGSPVFMDEQHGDFVLNGSFSASIRALGLPNLKHPLLFCRSLRPPKGSSLPSLLVAPWPRAWPELFQAGGVPVDDLEQLT